MPVLQLEIRTLAPQQEPFSWTANFRPPTVVPSQILLQLAASRGLESVCLVNNDEEAALALRLGAWKATLLKEVRA